MTLSDEGRRLFGVSGRAEYGPLRDALARSGLSVRPAVALGLLGAAGTLQLSGVALVARQLTDQLGTGLPTMLLVVRIGALAAAGLAVSGGWAVAGRPPTGRVRWAASGGLVGAVGLAVTGLAGGTWQLAAGAVLAGAATGVAWSVHLPLLFDHYRPEVRMRMAAWYVAMLVAGPAAAALVVLGAEGPLGLTWRGAFLILSALALLALLPVRGLADPAAGRWDAVPLAGRVRRALGGRGSGTGALTEAEVAVGASGRIRQVLSVPSLRLLLGPALFFGVLVVGDRPYLLTFWRDRWGYGETGQTALYALVMAVGAAGPLLVSRRAEVLWRLEPGRVPAFQRSAGWFGAALLLAGAWLPGVWPSTLVLGAATAAFAAAFVVTVAVGQAVVTPVLRPWAGLATGTSVLLGGLVGQQLLASIGSRFGVRSILLVTAVAGAAMAWSGGRATETASADLDEVVSSVAEGEELEVKVSRGAHLPLLMCRGIDFSYGQLQVLFDVDFSIDEGEMVALLGTNGAGKSTLLRVVSGLGLPTRGSVTFRGSDITHVDAGRRVQLGICQVPGGKAVFGPMSVLENLRVFGYARGRDQQAVDRGIESAFEAFPRLAERRNQQAATLSGGEQQMLGLAKAFILRPRLLLIDELSLGLAPIVVGELLEIVRRINADGTAVVLVEQSVNIALSLVNHAYFMEKGQVRFDGAARDLIDRPDLLRSVFLEGAGAVGR